MFRLSQPLLQLLTESEPDQLRLLTCSRKQTGYVRLYVRQIDDERLVLRKIVSYPCMERYDTDLLS